MSIIDDLVVAVEETLATIGRIIDRMIDAIADSLSNIINKIRDAVENIVGNVVDIVVDTFNRVASSIKNVFDKVVGRIVDFVESASNLIGNLVDRVVDFVSGLVERATDFLSDIYHNVVSSVHKLFNETVGFFSDIVDSIKFSIQNIVDKVVLFFGDIFDRVAQGINVVINSARDVTNSIAKAVEDFISTVVNGIGGALRDLLETIADLPDEISALATKLFNSGKENIKQPLETLPTDFILKIKEAISGEPATQADKMQMDSLALVFGRSPVIRSAGEAREYIQNMMPENNILRTIVIAIVSPLIIMQTMSGIAQANSQILLQEHAQANPYRLFEPADVIRANHFGIVEKDFVIQELRKTGYTQTAAEALSTIGESVIPAGELVAWWLRKIISDEDLTRGLKKNGFSDASINSIKKAAFSIPSPADLITMSVREVFSPEVAERFGQFDDFPQDFLKYAEQQGVNEEWAKRYWAAHWALPSTRMGFEMLQRGVIEEADLNLLLRASDVMPFWRDKLLEISYSPLTRVDVRRMHKIGVLTEDDVTKAYKDVGYNEENARRLTEFTVLLNNQEDAEDEGTLNDLTRSNIIGFFEDGLITYDEALSVLVSSGVNERSAELFLLSSELKTEREERKRQIDLIVQQVKSGVISYEQGQDALSREGFEALEKERALNQIDRDRAARNKLPSKSDLDKMFKNNIIDEATYKDTLTRIGYSEIWTNRFVQLTQRNDDG